jgi:hypothetical protein
MVVAVAISRRLEQPLSAIFTLQNPHGQELRCYVSLRHTRYSFHNRIASEPGMSTSACHVRRFQRRTLLEFCLTAHPWVFNQVRAPVYEVAQSTKSDSFFITSLR